MELFEPLGEGAPIAGFVGKNPPGGSTTCATRWRNLGGAGPARSGGARISATGSRKGRAREAGAVRPPEGFSGHAGGARAGLTALAASSVDRGFVAATSWLVLASACCRSAQPAIPASACDGAPARPRLLLRRLVDRDSFAGLPFGVRSQAAGRRVSSARAGAPSAPACGRRRSGHTRPRDAAGLHRGVDRCRSRTCSKRKSKACALLTPRSLVWPSSCQRRRRQRTIAGDLFLPRLGPPALRRCADGRSLIRCLLSTSSQACHPSWQRTEPDFSHLTRPA